MFELIDFIEQMNLHRIDYHVCNEEFATQTLQQIMLFHTTYPKGQIDRISKEMTIFSLLENLSLPYSGQHLPYASSEPENFFGVLFANLPDEPVYFFAPGVFKHVFEIQSLHGLFLALSTSYNFYYGISSKEYDFLIVWDPSETMVFSGRLTENGDRIKRKWLENGSPSLTRPL